MFATPQIKQISQTDYVAIHGTDRELVVNFFMEAVHLEAESVKAGRPIYEERPFIRINFPGDRTREIIRGVKLEDDTFSPADVNRFPQQWARFQNQQEPGQHGTPLEQWPQIRKYQVLELKGLKIHTVEQLASVPDTALHNLGMGARDLREMAQSYLSKAGDGAELSQLRARIAQLETDAHMAKEKASIAPAPELTKLVKDNDPMAAMDAETFMAKRRGTR